MRFALVATMDDDARAEGAEVLRDTPADTG